MQNKNYFSLIIWIVALITIGGVIGSLTKPEISTWYSTLNRSNLTPPNYVFPVAWTILYGIIGACHLTIMPSLTFIGSTRMQIEAVRVIQKYRGQKIGEWMMQEAIEYGKSKGASIIQLTTNKQRTSAKHFYEKLSFEATHEGMKLYLDKNYE